MTKLFIIDDDPINNYISEHSLRLNNPEIDLQIFVNPVEAVAFLNTLPFSPDVLLLLDLNMPQMSGWQVMERLVNLYDTYILSSSISQSDKEKSRAYQNVKGFISKPLNRAISERILSKQNLFILEQEVKL